jgi:phage tail-like protein
MPAPARKDPFKNYSFLVEIDGIAKAAFSEVSGLSGSLEVIEYREGSDVTTTRKLPGLVKYTNVTLKRGITNSRELYDWWRAGVNGTLQRREVAIVLLDDARTEVMRWLLHQAWIARFEIGPLVAEGNDVLIESIELAHEGFELA